MGRGRRLELGASCDGEEKLWRRRFGAIPSGYRGRWVESLKCLFTQITREAFVFICFWYLASYIENKYSTAFVSVDHNNPTKNLDWVSFYLSESSFSVPTCSTTCREVCLKVLSWVLFHLCCNASLKSCNYLI